MIFFHFFQDESPSGCISSGGFTTIMGKQLFVRLLAMTSTLMAGSLVFLVSGNTDLYEVVFKPESFWKLFWPFTFWVSAQVSILLKIKQKSVRNEIEAHLDMKYPALLLATFLSSPSFVNFGVIYSETVI